MTSQCRQDTDDVTSVVGNHDVIPSQLINYRLCIFW
jgi:hypothetical protein